MNRSLVGECRKAGRANHSCRLHRIFCVFGTQKQTQKGEKLPYQMPAQRDGRTRRLSRVCAMEEGRVVVQKSYADICADPIAVFHLICKKQNLLTLFWRLVQLQNGRSSFIFNYTASIRFRVASAVLTGFDLMKRIPGEVDGRRCSLLRAMVILARIFVLIALGTSGWANGAAMAQPATVPDTIAQRAVACTACHGKEGRANSEGFFPRIAGKPAGYLYNQLVNLREGRRRYPLMTYMVAYMTDDYLKELADYFSNLHPPYPPPQPANLSSTALERGRVLVKSGDPSRNIPACVACHGERLTGLLPAVPSLLGLPRDYLNAQFGAWKNGTRKATAPDCMAQISSRLSPEDIGSVSAWLASQPIPDDMTAAPPSSVELPIACGSVPK